MIILLLLWSVAYSAENTTTEQLYLIRREALNVEKSLLDNLEEGNATSEQIKSINHLVELSNQETSLAENRVKLLKKEITELSQRKEKLKERIDEQKAEIRKLLVHIHQSSLNLPKSFVDSRKEVLYSPFNSVIRSLIGRSSNELELLKVDLNDVEAIESDIEREVTQMGSLVEELEENRSILLFRKKLRLALLKANYGERVERLKKFNSMKDSELRLNHLLSEFDDHLKLEKSIEKRNRIAESMSINGFLRQKGQLSFPIDGKIVSQFGRSFDPESELYVFKKGVKIETKKRTSVKSVFSGKVVFSGQLKGYGNVVIMDHGSNYYSLLGNLTQSLVREGQWVLKDEAIGQLNDASAPLYFEIRDRNVAVNPLQWFANSTNL